jgi:hypothetical protein
LGPQTSAFSTPSFRPAFVPDPGPAFKRAVVERHAAATASKDEHAGGDQFMTDVIRRAGLPGSGGDSGGFGEHVVAAIHDVPDHRADATQATTTGAAIRTFPRPQAYPASA